MKSKINPSAPRVQDRAAPPQAPRRFHAAIRVGKRSPLGKYVLGYGLRVGYWPCLKAPYVQIAFHRWRVEIWHGEPSHLVSGDAP
jgi:hypothetical protein